MFNHKISLTPYMKCTVCSIRVYQSFFNFCKYFGRGYLLFDTLIIIFGFSTLIVANQLDFAQICSYYATEHFALCFCIPIILKILLFQQNSLIPNCDNFSIDSMCFIPGLYILTIARSMILVNNDTQCKYTLIKQST